MTEVGTTKMEAKIYKVVIEGCKLSPSIFNICIEEAYKLKKIKQNFKLKKSKERNQKNGEIVNILHFADDIAILVESEKI